jgi:hypothetical protein
MKTNLCALVVWSLTLAPACLAATQTGQASGHILILKNDRTLEGEIVCDGTQYVIRRPVGEITIPADRAQKLCADWDEAYSYIRSQANLRDPDERLRLARWCEQRGLRKQATDEAAAAVQLRPGHAESQRMLKHLQRVDHSTPPPPTTEANKSEIKALPAIDLNSEALSLFTTRVQPILMNACANCHCNGQGGSFQLLRIASSSATNYTATQHNLAAVLRRVDLERPAMSILLIKALSAHGGGGTYREAPIKKKDSPAYRSLEEWLHFTIASNPHLLELPELRRNKVSVAGQTAPSPSVLPSVVPSEQPGFAAPGANQIVPAGQTATRNLPHEPVPVSQESVRTVPTVAVRMPPQPARPTNVPGQAAEAEDAYSPAEFNRRVRPPQGPSNP